MYYYYYYYLLFFLKKKWPGSNSPKRQPKRWGLDCCCYDGDDGSRSPEAEKENSRAAETKRDVREAEVEEVGQMEEVGLNKRQVH